MSFLWPSKVVITAVIQSVSWEWQRRWAVELSVLYNLYRLIICWYLIYTQLVEVGDHCFGRKEARFFFPQMVAKWQQAVVFITRTLVGTLRCCQDVKLQQVEHYVMRMVLSTGIYNAQVTYHDVSLMTVMRSNTMSMTSYTAVRLRSCILTLWVSGQCDWVE